MFTSLLKTFLLSLPMSMGGLCNSGNSYVHNAYVRRNVATIKNEVEYDISKPQNNSYYVIHHKDFGDLFTNLPEYIEFTEYQSGGGTFYWSYSFAFEFFGNYGLSNQTHYYGIFIEKRPNVVTFRGFKNQNYTFATSDDYDSLFNFNISTGTFSKLTLSFDSIYVLNANVVDNYELANQALHYRNHYNSWECFNYFFYKGLKSFTFVEDVNYNALYQYDIESTFVKDSDFDALNPGATKVKTLTNVPFISNGIIFNEFRLRYFNAYATAYYDSWNQNVYICSEDGLAYFGFSELVPMTLVDSNNNPDIKVGFYRNQRTITKDGGVVTYIVDNCSWNNLNYQNIEFLDDISESELTAMSAINKGEGLYSYRYGGGNLGNAFNLMRVAFSGFSALFGISIIPGLSIGLLLFLPLLMSMVVLVFKAVKK